MYRYEYVPLYTGGGFWLNNSDCQHREIIGQYALVSCCNGRYYGGGFMPVPEARMDDGRLETIIVKNVSRLKFARFVGAYAKGGYAAFPQLARVVHAKVVKLHSEDQDIVTCLDGESIRSRDVTLRLSEKKVNFFGPAGFDCNATARDRR